MELLYVYLISAAIAWFYIRLDNGDRSGTEVIFVICPIVNSALAIIAIQDLIVEVIPNFKFWKKVPYWFFLKKYPKNEDRIKD